MSIEPFAVAFCAALVAYGWERLKARCGWQ
jgi:hypothetical protein